MLLLGSLRLASYSSFFFLSAAFRLSAHALNDGPDLFQVGMYILSRWFDQQFVLLSCFVLADILTQEIEPLLDMRHAGFFV